MDRREMLGMLGAGAVGLATVAGRAAADDDHKGHEAHDEKHEAMSRECLQACSECARACDEAYHHCLMAMAEGKKESGWTLQMVGDCGTLCGVSAGMIARHSPLMAASCHGTAHATKMTLAHVQKHAGDDPKARDLIAKLQTCEKSCTMMVEHMREMHKMHEEKKEEKSKA
jgi:hypothetical protein